MSNATADRVTRTRVGDVLSLAVYTASKIFAGTMVQKNATGYAVKASATAANKTMGIAAEQVDNPGASGDKRIDVRRNVIGLFGNSAAGDAITIADIGNPCYVVDDQTVAKTDNAGARPQAGKIVDVEAAGVWVEFGDAGGAAAVAALAAGKKVAFGQHETVTAADTIATGLATVESIVASFETDPADANTYVSAQKGDQAGAPAAGSVIIKTWKQNGADPTPIAADAFGKLVNWIAIGT